MNKEAKIGLFAVLVLVVLVVVMWAKLAGEDERETNATDSVASDPGSSAPNETLIATDNSSAGDPAADLTYTDPLQSESPFEGQSSDVSNTDPSSEWEQYTNKITNETPDPYESYEYTKTGNETTTKEKTLEDPFNFNLVQHTDTKNTLAEKTTRTDYTYDWGNLISQDKKTEPPPASDTFTTTNTFNRFGGQLGEWPKVYEVVKGDTLAGIAQKYYKAGKYWRLIADANKAALPDPAKLKIGMRIKIPQPPPVYEAKATFDAVLVAKPGVSYKVKKGDTLISISRSAYGTGQKWQAILALNKSKLSSPEKLAEGMVISLPANP